mmetsp:Transcript_9487/g.22541  ORF Transcript_9487/g.22541 Transcript_9487/m.22541 type:complete len:482 (-) Transcript_9487:519-1964(-)
MRRDLVLSEALQQVVHVLPRVAHAVQVLARVLAVHRDHPLEEGAVHDHRREVVVVQRRDQVLHVRLGQVEVLRREHEALALRVRLRQLAQRVLPPLLHRHVLTAQRVRPARQRERLPLGLGGVVAVAAQVRGHRDEALPALAHLRRVEAVLLQHVREGRERRLQGARAHLVRAHVHDRPRQARALGQVLLDARVEPPVVRVLPALALVVAGARAAHGLLKPEVEREAALELGALLRGEVGRELPPPLDELADGDRLRVSPRVDDHDGQLAVRAVERRALDDGDGARRQGLEDLGRGVAAAAGRAGREGGLRQKGDPLFVVERPAGRDGEVRPGAALVAVLAQVPLVVVVRGAVRVAGAGHAQAALRRQRLRVIADELPQIGADAARLRVSDRIVSRRGVVEPDLAVGGKEALRHRGHLRRVRSHKVLRHPALDQGRGGNIADGLLLIMREVAKFAVNCVGRLVMAKERQRRVGVVAARLIL